MRKFITYVTAAGLFALTCSAVIAATMSALSSMDTQTAKVAKTPYAVMFTGDTTAAIKIEGTKITVLRAGDYYLNAAAQIGGNGTGDVYLWLRVNGKDVEDSNSVQTVSSPTFTAVLVAQTGITFKKGDVLEIMYAATAPGLGLIASKPAGMPGVLAIIMSLFEM